MHTIGSEGLRHAEAFSASDTSAGSWGWRSRLIAGVFAVAALGASQEASIAAVTGGPRASCASAASLPQLRWAPTPEWPDQARGENATGSVVMQIDLDDGAAIRNVGLLRSSGSPALDAEAMRVAARSKFAPASPACGSSVGSYKFVIDFNA